MDIPLPPLSTLPHVCANPLTPFATVCAEFTIRALPRSPSTNVMSTGKVPPARMAGVLVESGAVHGSIMNVLM
jgi:hypothetical protein